jgi:hypothetical protein
MALAISVIWLAAAGIEWSIFEPPNSGFTVLMPGQPGEHKKKVALPQGFGELILFDATLKGSDVRCVAAYTDYPSAAYPAGTLDKRLDNARDGAVSASRGRLARERSIVLGVNPGRELTITIDGKNTMVMRLYAVNDRLFQVAVVGPADVVTSANAAKFLESFKLAK